MSQPDGKRLTVLIPVSEAALQLEEVHRQVSDQLDQLGLDYEMIYLVQTNSAPTLDLVRRIHERGTPRVRVIQSEQDVGEAAMLTAGFERRKGDLILTIPRNLEVDFACIPRLLESIREGADVAIACRGSQDSVRAAQIQSRLFNRMISWAAGTRFRDVASGTRAIRPQVFEETRIYGDFHRYLPILAERAGFAVREVPSALHARAQQPLVHKPIIYLWRALDIASVLLISRFTRKPLRLFGGLGAGFAGVGFLMLLILGIQRILGQPLAERPALLLATMLVGLGVQAIAIGLLGELILFFNSRGVRDYRISAVYEAMPPLADGPPTPSDASPLTAGK